MWLVCIWYRSSCGQKAGFPLTPPSFLQRPPPYPIGHSSLLGQGCRHTGRVRKEKTGAKSEAEQSHVIMGCGSQVLRDTTRVAPKAQSRSLNPDCSIYTKLIPDVRRDDDFSRRCSLSRFEGPDLRETDSSIFMLKSPQTNKNSSFFQLFHQMILQHFSCFVMLWILLSLPPKVVQPVHNGYTVYTP